MISRRRLLIILTTYSISFFFAILIAMVFSSNVDKGYESIPVMIFSNIIIFSLSFFGAGKFSDFWSKYLHSKDINTGLTYIITSFLDDIRNAYSINEMVNSIQINLEKKGDCSVLLIDSEKDYVIYNSPSNITQDEKLYSVLSRNFSRLHVDGCYFFDQDLGLLSDSNNARGFFIVFNSIKLFVFCNATRIFSTVIFEMLFEELKKFYTRYNAIIPLSEIDELSQEWSMVADTQKAFLPQTLPSIDKLDMDVYFKPLINVSGDYYTVLEISKTKSLILLGDVSGKGFSAALIMGIVINIVKTMGNKTDLPNLVYEIDNAIKNMHFDDKYTVLFVALLDTENMTLSYINASIADICILTDNPAGYKAKWLESTCSIIGLIDIGNLEIKTVPLFWGDVLFFATDGLCECVDKNGVELGCSEVFNTTIANSAKKDPTSFIHDINALAFDYTGGKKFRDDITILVLKVKR